MSRTIQKIGSAVNNAIKKVAEVVAPVDPLGSKILDKTADSAERLNTNENIKLAATVAAAVAGGYAVAAYGAAGAGTATAAGAGSTAAAGGSYSATAFGTAAGYGGANAAIILPSTATAATGVTAAGVANSVLNTAKTVSQVSSSLTALKALNGNAPVVDTTPLPVGYGVDYVDTSVPPPAPQSSETAPVVVSAGGGGVSPAVAAGLIGLGLVAIMATRKGK